MKADDRAPSNIRKLVCARFENLKQVFLILLIAHFEKPGEKGFVVQDHCGRNYLHTTKLKYNCIPDS